MAAYNNLTDPLYSPSKSIKSFHQLPHLDAQLHPQSSEFAWDMQYYASIYEFPAILFGISFILMCMYKLIQWFRSYCYNYWSRTVNYGCPNFTLKRYLLCNPKRTLSSQEESHEFRSKTFYFLCFSLMFVNCFLFYGSAGMTHAAHTFSDSASDLQNIFNSIVDDGLMVVNETHVGMSFLPGCAIPTPLSTQIYNNLTAIGYSADMISSNADPISNDVQNVLNVLTDFAVSKKDAVVASFFCVVLAVSVWYAVSLQQQSYFYFKLCQILAWQLLFGLCFISLFGEVFVIVSIFAARLTSIILVTLSVCYCRWEYPTFA
jgi:hypothetical protein